MSHTLINRNLDLKKLRDEGYQIEIKSAHLLVHGIPYVNSKREIVEGVLVAPLGDMAGGVTTKPQDHVIHFIGELPCDPQGVVLTGIISSSGRRTLAEGIEVDHSFSSKPPDGYADYYEKVTTYAKILYSQAQAIDPEVTAKEYKVIVTDESDLAHHYLDTNSSRAGISAISEKLENLKIAIIGLGGTGAYILDFVTKTYVKEIHLYDDDRFFSHNAFRSPGAASVDVLDKQPKKVSYLHAVYSKMHKHIVPHEYYVTASTLDELSGMDFVFICIDEGATKKEIIARLVASDIPFVDTGIDVTLENDRLNGAARVTTGAKEKNDHVEKRISFSNNTKGVYNSNIQIAELNALNAALAVIKWKKLFGFYHDLVKEYHTIYDININKLTNDETVA